MRHRDQVMDEAAAVAAVQSLLESQKGYPAAAMSRQIASPDGGEVDLAIFSPDTESLLAAFEFKEEQGTASGRTESLKRALERLARVVPRVPLFGVLLSVGGAPRYFRRDDEAGLVAIDFDDIPSFGVLLGGVAVRREARERKARDAAVRSIRIKAHLASALCLILFVTGVLGLWIPSWESLTLAAAAMGFWFVPEIEVLRLKEVEIRFRRSREATGAEKQE